MTTVRTTPFTVSDGAYRAELRRLVGAALAEDIGAGDRTTAALDLRRRMGVARLIARTPGVLAGADAFAAVYRSLDRSVRLTWRCRDGHQFKAGATIVTIRGRAAAILTGERTAINFLAHLSGVATKAREMVARIPRGTAQLLDTRKTTPGWRLLEKRAAVIGGAANHRLGLYDALMIKENHITACGDIETAIRRAQAGRRGRPLICEVRNISELRLVLSLGIDWVLLDNFMPSRLRAAVGVIRKHERVQKCRVRIEASGGITLRNIATVARTGVDFISTGAITHSAPAIDFSMQWVGPGAS